LRTSGELAYSFSFSLHISSRIKIQVLGSSIKPHLSDSWSSAPPMTIHKGKLQTRGHKELEPQKLRSGNKRGAESKGNSFFLHLLWAR
jgi:hypothetical protein